MINSLPVVIEQCTAKSGFSTFSARDLVLLRSESLTPFFVRFLNSGYRNGSGEFPIGTWPTRAASINKDAELNLLMGKKPGSGGVP
jgi:hypothetical protein